MEKTSPISTIMKQYKDEERVRVGARKRARDRKRKREWERESVYVKRESE